MRCFPILILALAVDTAAAFDLERIDAAIVDGRAADVVVDLVRAADSGDAAAQRMLATLYQRGDGVARNVERAAELYQLAAAQGDAEAQFNLANMYLLGEGVEPDEAWAMTYYRKAANQGHALALRNLNQLLRAAGIAEPGNAADSRAAAAAAAQIRTEPNVAKRLGVGADALAPVTRLDENATAPADEMPTPAPTPEELARRAADEQEALRLAAEHGIQISLDDAAVDLVPSSPMRRAVPGGASEESGDPVAPETDVGGSMRAATDDGSAGSDAAAKFELAQRYLVGEGVEPDEAMAITLLRAAAGEGHVQARERLAQIYRAAGLPVPPIGNTRGGEASNTDERQPAARAAQAPRVKTTIEISSAAPSTNASEPTLDEARRALDDGNLKRAARMFTALAERGNAEAQAHIGYMTYRGEGVAQDSAAAAEWYRKAAEQGNADAQYNLAVAYANGDGVARDPAAALTWYQRAAEQGSVFAQYSLGVAYARGTGTAQDATIAASWYLEAARQGHPAAQYNLAYAYLAGEGVARSTDEALYWFRQAAQQEHPAAQFSLAQMYRNGTGVEPDLDEALRWYRRAAALGHAAARTELAALETTP